MTVYLRPVEHTFACFAAGIMRGTCALDAEAVPNRPIPRGGPITI